jgi:hypothetical protein
MRMLILSLVVLCAGWMPAGAATITYDVMLDGTQAGTGSPGTGSALVVLDDSAMTLSVDLTFSGLLAPTTNAHIHCCAPPGSNAGVIIPFVPPFVVGATSGTFTNTFNLNATQVADVESGLSYINIHTTQYPAGEIRGQITPEPGTFALLGIALAGFGAGLRAKTRRDRR